MTYALYTVISALFLSLAGNVFSFIKIKTTKNNKRTESIELQEFLVDLMGGTAIVAVTRVDPEAILIRSTRQK